MRIPNSWNAMRCGGGTLARKHCLSSADSGSSTKPARTSPSFGCLNRNRPPPLPQCQMVVDERNDVALFVGEVLVQPSPEFFERRDELVCHPRVGVRGP